MTTYVIWKGNWRALEMPKTWSGPVIARCSRKAMLQSVIKKRVIEIKKRRGIIWTPHMETFHSERLPFLKNKDFAKLKLKLRGRLSKRQIQNERGYHWDWKYNRLFSPEDPAHPYKLWKREMDPDGLTSLSSVFYGKRDRDYYFKWTAKRKKRYYNLLKKVSRARASIIFNDWGWQAKWANERKKKILSNISLTASREVKTTRFKLKRSGINIRNIATNAAEGVGFWRVNWWKKNSIVYKPEWNFKSWCVEDVRYMWRSDKNEKLAKKNSYRNNPFESVLSNSSAKYLFYFYRKLFKTLFYKTFSHLKKIGRSDLLIYYKNFKMIYNVFSQGIKSFVTKSAIRPAAYFLSNLAYSPIKRATGDWTDGRIVLSREGDYARHVVNSASLPSTYSVHSRRLNSRIYFSNFYKINNYLILKYFFYIFSKAGLFQSLSEKKKKEKISSVFRFISIYAKSNYKRSLLYGSLNGPARTAADLKAANGHKNLSKKKRNLYRVFYACLVMFQKYNLEQLSIEELRTIWKRPVQFGKISLLKGSQLLKHRSIFYNIRKKIPKFYKSNKKIRLFKKFTRNYSSRLKPGYYRLSRIVGLANRYAKMVGCRRYFKQKIYIRAKFMAHYKGADRTKMNNRWKRIQKARHKWVGFYNEFEGVLLRAGLWAGLANKYNMSKFFVENDLILINAAAGNGSRQPVGSGDILYLRKDIFRYLNKKKELKLVTRYFSKMPFYNKLFKNKIINRAKKMARIESLNKRRFKRRSIFSNVLSRLKANYLKRALYVPNTDFYSDTQPYIRARDQKHKWQRRVKKVSSAIFKENILKKKIRR